MDEHTTTVDAAPDVVWAALLTTLDRSALPGVGLYTRIVGCSDPHASGPRPLAVGSTIPGFRVSAAAPGRELVLTGRHRFADYALAFRLDPQRTDTSRPATSLTAESRAHFGGVPGVLYRTLVIGTGGHVAAVRMLLSRTRLLAVRNAARTTDD